MKIPHNAMHDVFVDEPLKGVGVDDADGDADHDNLLPTIMTTRSLFVKHGALRRRYL